MEQRRFWGDKPYYSLNYYLRETFGEKIYKLALDGGMTCPNRDGTLGTRGCIFCSEGGSGDFAENCRTTVDEQIQAAKGRVAGKVSGPVHYIAYFQSYTNTYAPTEYLRELFTETISHPDIVALSIGTRPDCLSREVIGLLAELNTIKPVWVELGLQTIHESTARYIHRGYPLSCFEQSFHTLKAAGLTVIVHLILGLPGETRDMILDSVRYLGNIGIGGIKLQLLHILKGTALADIYQTNPFPVYTLDSYTDLVIDCLELLPQSVVIHRLTGDGPKSLLIEPSWSANKRLVLNTMTHRLKERQTYQGRCADSYLPS